MSHHDQDKLWKSKNNTFQGALFKYTKNYRVNGRSWILKLEFAK